MVFLELLVPVVVDFVVFQVRIIDVVFSVSNSDNDIS